MENPHNCRTLHIPLFSQLVLLLQFSSLHFLSLAYEVQEKYFVNCGSDANLDLNGRNFIGDLKPDSFSFSKGSETIKGTNLTISSLYQTARVFSQQSYYNFEITETGTYLTAKEMTGNSSNITWSFSVRRNARYIVRAHFCDIVSVSAHTIVFDLYSNGNFRKQIFGLDSPFVQALATPFYYDFVVNATDSKLINIRIAPNLTNTTIENAFLNGLEILEILEGTALIYNLEESKKVSVALVVGSVLGGGLFLFIIGFMLCLRHKKARKRNRGGISHNLGLKISFAQIRSATNNFDPKMQIGVGGFGYVYKGTLSNGTKVAVKRCKQEGQRSGQGLPEFETEIIVLSKIRHRHLVSLIGYCDEGSEMILVYEFMEKGTLRDHLYESDVPRLSWKQRLEICIGSATGLDYLHKGAAGGIIHRDVKSTNILLDENLVAKVADFGLSRSGPLDETHVSTVVKGTIGYLDPEYMMSQQLTEKSDVYSFGVVLLEVLCGRPAIDITLPREKVNLAEWVVLCKKEGLLEEVIDVSLKGRIDPSSLRHFIETAEKCLQHDSSDRPTMAEVLWDLDYTLKLHQTARLGEAHEDSTTSASSAFLLPNIRHFASLGSTVNGADMRDDEMESTESEIFSQLRIGEAR
ncbi:probable receptor-like protein kinase At2g23200 [Rosa chinensis]|uniref:probable receptor-like protein kinase At2g23200 n=1 Tax=Rosa chinensis TaxID=74649 RepID=UPI001AD8CD6F|nr:probable receptor-like protein kinase At2g23200 [Rosa chinensis]